MGVVARAGGGEEAGCSPSESKRNPSRLFVRGGSLLY